MQTISAQNALLAFTSIKTSNAPKSMLNAQTSTLKPLNAKVATMDTLYLRVAANCHRLRKNLKSKIVWHTIRKIIAFNVLIGFTYLPISAKT
jgi:hypothetical protein